MRPPKITTSNALLLANKAMINNDPDLVRHLLARSDSWPKPPVRTERSTAKDFTFDEALHAIACDFALNNWTAGTQCLIDFTRKNYPGFWYQPASFYSTEVPFLQAASHGNVEMVQLLLDQTDPTPITKMFGLCRAVLNENNDTVSLIWDSVLKDVTYQFSRSRIHATWNEAGNRLLYMASSSEKSSGWLSVFAQVINPLHLIEKDIKSDFVSVNEGNSFSRPQRAAIRNMDMLFSCASQAQKDRHPKKAAAIFAFLSHPNIRRHAPLCQALVSKNGLLNELNCQPPDRVGRTNKI